MHFFPKTGFGISTNPHGDSKCNIFMGLAQGSGGASSVCLVVNMFIIQAYEHAGHRATFQSTWSSLLMTVVTVPMLMIQICSTCAVSLQLLKLTLLVM